jgi:nitrogen fixation protein NifB
MDPREAVTRLNLELGRRKNLRIIAVSGPGDPLASKNAMETLHRIRQSDQDAKICLSTNGTLLEERISDLQEIMPSTISVSIHAATPQTASKIYEWIEMDARVPVSSKIGDYILNKQLTGIRKASAAGILVKVNTVLIPEINENEIVQLAKRISQQGATLHNVIPLIPSGRLRYISPPSIKQLNNIRKKASQHIPQFYHCYQCRSDVVGIPGQDDIL